VSRRSQSGSRAQSIFFDISRACPDVHSRDLGHNQYFSTFQGRVPTFTVGIPGTINIFRHFKGVSRRSHSGSRALKL